MESWPEVRNQVRDPRHYEPQATENTWDSEFASLSAEWTTHNTLSQLEAMLKSSDPNIG
jgi:hypothetical protein